MSTFSRCTNVGLTDWSTGTVRAQVLLHQRGRATCTLRAAFLVSAALATTPVRAQEATWLSTTMDTNINNAGNWDSGAVPIGGTAIFGTQNTLSSARFPGTTADTTLAQIKFVPGAPNPGFTIGITGGNLTITGSVSNTSGVEQGFVVTSGWTLTFGPNSSALASNANGIVLYGNRGGMLLFNGSTAGGANIEDVNAGSTIVFNNGDAGTSAIRNVVGSIIFQGASTAHQANILNGVPGDPNETGAINFSGTSTAGSSTISNASLSSVKFSDGSTAGEATIGNAGALSFTGASSGGASMITNTGTTAFADTATADQAVITNTGVLNFTAHSSDGASTIANTGTTTFAGVATADQAIVTNTGALNFTATSTAAAATITTSASGITTFHDGSLGGMATIITNTGGTTNFTDLSSAQSANVATNNGGLTTFTGTSIGGAANITTNSGGSTQFLAASNGAVARFITNNGGAADISQLTTTGMTAGSIEGAGSYFLGSKAFTVGLNNLSTTVSGVIEDGGLGGGAGGSLIKTGTGTLTLTNVDPYSGGTTVNQGTLVVGDPSTPAAALSGGGHVTVVTGATFGGYGSVTGNVSNHGTIVAGNATPGFGASPTGTFTIIGTFVNTGTVNLASDPAVGNVLQVKNYVGSNGVMNINTVLGDDTSPTDQLVINGGTATGNTSVHVNNAGGAGALTLANGIPIVRAINGATTATGAFALNGILVAGPYQYDLLRGGLNGSNPNDWFLRSALVVEPPTPPGPTPPGPMPPEPPPLPPPEPPFPPDPPPDPLPPGVYPIIGPRDASYGVVQPIARQMGTTILGTLHERIGDTLTDGDASASGPVPSAWGRVFVQQVNNGYQAFAAPSATGQILGVQAGLDIWHGSIFPGQRDTAGVYFAFGNANLSVDGLVTNPEDAAYVRMRTGWLHLNAYSVGGYWTHYGSDGWYLDAVVQHTLYRGNSEAQFSDFNLISRLPTDGTGIITSLEGGYPFAVDLGTQFILEPQAQLMWQQASFNLANDGLETVGLGATSGITGRLGVRAKWTINDQDGEVWQPYARFNIWQNWGGRAATDFGGSATLVPLVEQATWGEVAGGVTFKTNDGFGLFAQAGYQFALTDHTSISGFNGSFGPRFTW
jgi:outer membrane autotransporter protein